MRDILTKFAVGCIIGVVIFACVYLMVHVAAFLLPIFAY